MVVDRGAVIRCMAIYFQLSMLMTIPTGEEYPALKWQNGTFFQHVPKISIKSPGSNKFQESVSGLMKNQCGERD